VGKLSAGSTIYVGAGVYRERLTVTNIAGTAELPVRIVADRSGAQTGGPSGEAVIDGAGGLVAVIITNSPWLTLDGFIVRGVAPTAESAAVDIRVRGDSDHVTIQHCTVANAALADGIRVDSSDDVLLFNNLVFGTDRGVVITGSASDTRLINNSIALTDRAGLSVRAAGGAEPRDVEVINTIIQEAGPAVALDATAADGFTGDFNLVFQPELEDPATAYLPTSARGENDLNVDALFVNIGVGDLHLEPDSPAVDAGSGDIDSALEDELLRRSTDPDGARDEAPVDMGYHYPR
jgi:parallel beta-helix repeat protein